VGIVVPIVNVRMTTPRLHQRTHDNVRVVRRLLSPLARWRVAIRKERAT
jgi:hypothetical protein